MALPPSVFADIGDQLFKYRYEVELHVGVLVGGTPTNQDVATSWIRTKMGLTTDQQVKEQVEKVMNDRGVSPDDAAEKVAEERHLSGFRRDFGSPLARADQKKATTSGFVLEGKRKVFTEAEARTLFGELFLEGRQAKAMLKENLMIGVASGHIDATKWGKTSKSAKGFFVEHLFVEEEEIRLGVTEPSEVAQSFVHTWRGSGIKLEERARDVIVKFTIIADFDFEAKVKGFFGILFALAERNGIGASRSQGYGRFSTVRFERVESSPETTAKATKRAQAIIEEDRRREAEREAVKSATV